MTFMQLYGTCTLATVLSSIKIQNVLVVPFSKTPMMTTMMILIMAVTAFFHQHLVLKGFVT